MAQFIDRTGEKHHLLTFVKRIPSNDKRTLWECQCECGNIKIVLGTGVVNGHTKSCGCLMRLKNNPLRITHGKYKTKLYAVWRSMKQRCNNSKDKGYKNYGGRGIKLCTEWEDYSVFEKWAQINGYKQGLTIDRSDNDKGYNPDNCKWVPQKEQLYNLRKNIKILYKGIKYKINELAKLSGLPEKTIRDRYHAKWSIDKIINTPYIKKIK